MKIMENKKKVVQISLNPTTYDKLKTEADDKSITLSSLIKIKIFNEANK